MTVTAQDGKLTFNSETGRWEDEDGNIGWEHKRVCSQCGKPRLDLNGVSACDVLNRLADENEQLRQRIRDMTMNGCGYDE